jgi:hypothetical protein
MSISHEEKNKGEIQITPRERIVLGLAKASGEKRGKCELLLKEIDSIIQKIKDGQPKEEALISFEERKKRQEAFVPLKNEYTRKRSELLREMNFVTDYGFKELAGEHLRQLDKIIEPASTGRTLSGVDLIAEGLKKTHIEEPPDSTPPIKTEIKAATPTGIPEAARQEILELERRMKSTILEMWQIIDHEITPENFEEHRNRIIEKLKGIQVSKKDRSD